MTPALRAIGNRIYSDFLMGSRLDAYRVWLEAALAAGYRVGSVGSTWRSIRDRQLDPAGRYLALRHDVDTDPGTAGAMWAIERSLGITSSYFFRLSTLAPDLMAEIDSAGGEASYHYEELATIAKRQGLHTRTALLDRLPEGRDLFAANVQRLRAETGLPIRVVASHGDFVNRRLGVPNWVILEDSAFRGAVGIELETYDQELLSQLPNRHTDVAYPDYWEPSDPAFAVRDGVPIISVLVHPRHWRTDRMVNARDDLGRLVEGVRYRLPSRTRSQA